MPFLTPSVKLVGAGMSPYDSDYMTRQLPFDSSAAVITNFDGTPNGLATESAPEDDASPSGCSSG